MQLYIAENFQVAVIRREETFIYILKDYTDIFKIDVFFIFFDKCLSVSNAYLVGDAKLVFYAEHPIMFSAPKHPNIRLLITLVFFFELNFITNILQKMILILIDSVIVFF